MDEVFARDASVCRIMRVALSVTDPARFKPPPNLISEPERSSSLLLRFMVVFAPVVNVPAIAKSSLNERPVPGIAISELLSTVPLIFSVPPVESIRELELSLTARVKSASPVFKVLLLRVNASRTFRSVDALPSVSTLPFSSRALNAVSYTHLTLPTILLV